MDFPCLLSRFIMFSTYSSHLKNIFVFMYTKYFDILLGRFDGAMHRVDLHIGMPTFQEHLMNYLKTLVVFTRCNSSMVTWTFLFCAPQVLEKIVECVTSWDNEFIMHGQTGANFTGAALSINLRPKITKRFIRWSSFVYSKIVQV